MQNSGQSIENLIADAKAGDRQALELLLTQYRPYLRILAEQEIGPALQRRIDGSDVAQQTCIEAVVAFPKFLGSTEPQFTAWVKTILNHNVINLIRDNKAGRRDVGREKELGRGGDNSATLNWYEPAGQDSSPSERAIRGEAALELAQAVETLPDDQRRAVQLRYLEARSLDEIGRELNRSQSAVAGLLHRGLMALRSKVDVS